MIDFCFDNLLPESFDGYYPNLIAPGSIQVQVDQIAENQRPWELGAEYPFIDYCRLLDFMREENLKFTVHSVKTAPNGSFYPIDITFFDHGTDYFGMMGDLARERLQQRQITVLFVYCEADNPIKIQRKIYELAGIHNINPLDVKFVSGVFVPDVLPDCMPANFLFLDEGSIMYASGHREIYQEPLQWHDRPRSKKMTYLNRVHKSWRAFFAAWYWKQGYHHDSYFSYCNVDQSQDVSPLRDDVIKDTSWKVAVDDFLAAGPFYADSLTDKERNYLGGRVDEHFADSYWNLSVETFLSLDGDFPGVFITEKTWKPIAQAQPFLVLGSPYTLETLQNWGFKTFYAAGIDESYDCITNHTDRFLAVMKQVERIHAMSYEQLHQFHLGVRGIVEHNQRLFWDLGPRVVQEFVRELTNDR